MHSTVARTLGAFVVCFGSFAIAPSPSLAEVWPERGVKIITSFPAGTGGDLSARLGIRRLCLRERAFRNACVPTREASSMTIFQQRMCWCSAVSCTIGTSLQKKCSYERPIGRSQKAVRWLFTTCCLTMSDAPPRADCYQASICCFGPTPGSATAGRSAPIGCARRDFAIRASSRL